MALYFGWFRSGCRCAITECSRVMSAPTLGSWRRLKRVARYTRGHTKVMQEMAVALDKKDLFEICCDSDRPGRPPHRHYRRRFAAKPPMTAPMTHWLGAATWD